MGRYKWGYKSSNMGYKYSYPTYNLTNNYPRTSKYGLGFLGESRDLVSKVVLGSGFKVSRSCEKGSVVV